MTFKCRDCSGVLTRENTGTYQEGRPHACKECERAHEQFVYEQFLKHESYDDFAGAVLDHKLDV